MSRAARILAELESERSVSADDLADSIVVSRRTIANEIATLQYLMGTAASITLTDGRYRLLIADPPRYRAVRASVAGEPSFNDPVVRASYIVAKLFHALVPVRIDDLAAGMSVSRTTVVGDIARVRDLVAESELTIDGRPNAGLTLSGPELQQRLHVLRWHFPMAYPADSASARVELMVHQLASEVRLDSSVVPELSRWAIVAVDRARTERRIDDLSERYAGLAATPAHELATTLSERISASLNVRLDGGDRVFLALPVAGMRAPENHEAAERFAVSDTAVLVNDVLAAVQAEMEIDLTDSGFLSEFGRHLAYMINRMRYRIWVDDAGVANIRHEFPVSYRMATVAAEVVAEQVGMPVDEAEVSFLAAYFQVFLESRKRSGASPLSIVIVASTGRVTAELVRLQLSKLLPTSAHFVIVALADATPDRFEGADLVVVTGDDELACTAPVLHITRILDSSALERQLERLKLRLPVAAAGRPGSVIAASLDDQHFFALPSGTDYADAVDFMTGHLEARGNVEPGFGDRIRAREEVARMQLDPWLGFPHATLETQTDVMLAVGVVAREPGEEGVRLVILLGVPADAGQSHGILVQVYDEVLRLGARRDLLTELSRATSFEDFYYSMHTHTLGERLH
ncbi:HTH domain-containing protein [Tessaracoccus sp. MC1679]|uniref:BglG family transcription antiterminator n=1 Tax=Tessaracoccus sp. MC1679 TaxID=2760313 RepID=UPI0016033EAC|nr:HTH domain-containing protein [Tessaracoccus sp. MC1679]MBB1515243.1 HTH domain-containing protein [Tessaracoccus sp. MC1679]